MRARRFLVALFLLAVGLGTAGILRARASGDVRPRFRGATVAGWPTLGGDFQRTGLSPQAGPVQGGVYWKFETDGAIVSSPTVDSDGVIYVACEDGKLYALSQTGEPLSVVDVNTPLVSTPTIGVPGGYVYVGSKDGRLLEVTRDGSVRQIGQTGDAIYAAPALWSNASLVASSSGDIYVASTDGTLYAMWEGGERWRFRTKGPGASPTGAIFASPTLAGDGTVYVAGMYDPNLYALNPRDGSVKWVCRFPADSPDDEIGGWPFAAPVVGADGTIYQTLLYDRHLYAINPDTGTIRWAVDLCDPNLFGPNTAALLEGSGWSEPVLGPDGTIYVSLDDPYLRAVDPSGKIKWVTRLGQVGGWPPTPVGIDPPIGPIYDAAGDVAGDFTLTVDKDGLIYAAGDDGFVYVVSPGSLLIARFQTGGWPVYPVLVVDDLLIVVDSRDYSGYAEGGKNAVWAISSKSLYPPNGPID